MSIYQNNLIIRRPTVADRKTILEMIEEYQEADSSTSGLWNFANNQDKFEGWIESNFLQETGLLGKGIPAIQLVAFDDQNQALGFLNIRLRLDQELLSTGGHIGYSVRPSKRGRGIAKKMLKEAIAIAATKNIQNILVTCHQDNQASRAVILANGGVFENSIDETERYWIKSYEQS
ncbi:GNAT family N-acetyltransferase [Streptococcus thoraltensis]|uniref:GNAT family N-acetyltransferase n=1 Tax=Streptococcus thoraltensis TaxID=55085 RepID=UPI00035F51D9|nr:GNAT family N-acetyltransferase [Streptococcus thoraltensis]MDY4762224.1 GNAT family N-acetyltransferase [Streptococcus thoraltensis]